MDNLRCPCCGGRVRTSGSAYHGQFLARCRRGCIAGNGATEAGARENFRKSAHDWIARRRESLT